MFPFGLERSSVDLHRACQGFDGPYGLPREAWALNPHSVNSVIGVGLLLFSHANLNSLGDSWAAEVSADFESNRGH